METLIAVCPACKAAMAATAARKDRSRVFTCKGAADHTAHTYVNYKKIRPAPVEPAPEPVAATAPARVRGAAKELRERAKRLR